MNIQEQEEMDFNRMSPYEFNEAAVKQDGYLRPAAQYLLTDYDTLVLNPFWDGVTEWDFSEAYEDGRDQDGGCPWCGRDCPDAGKPEGCWYQGCPDFPHGE